MSLNIKQITGRIKAYDGVRIAEKVLREVVCANDYNDYYKIVVELVSSNVITPVKSSGSNGMRPPLHKRYNIVKPAAQYGGLIQEIRLLHESFNIEGYLNDPEKYKRHRDWVMPLEHFLKNHEENLEIPCSINERSFQIFRREKALKEDRELAAVLGFNQGLKELLNFYHTPEPFHAFHISPWNGASPDKPLNILIIENKDTWFTLRNRMSQGRSSIAGIEFHCILYGEGRKISRANDSLTDFDGSYFKSAKTCYYYFGDLDYEGISIVYDLIRVNPLLEIRLMLPLYTTMLDASKGIQLPVSNENQKSKSGEWFLSFLDAAYRPILQSILESGRYIPQEILDNGELMKLIDAASPEGR